jgi:tRNA A37 threonylcarbamoyladenosine biosynthesis protein TsaE
MLHCMWTEAVGSTTALGKSVIVKVLIRALSISAFVATCTLHIMMYTIVDRNYYHFDCSYC